MQLKEFVKATTENRHTSSWGKQYQEETEAKPESQLGSQFFRQTVQNQVTNLGEEMRGNVQVYRHNPGTGKQYKQVQKSKNG